MPSCHGALEMGWLGQQSGGVPPTGSAASTSAGSRWYGSDKYYSPGVSLVHSDKIHYDEVRGD